MKNLVSQFLILILSISFEEVFNKQIDKNRVFDIPAAYINPVKFKSKKFEFE